MTFLFFFLPTCLVVYYLCPRRNWRNTVLFIMSIFFYAWGEPVYVILLLLSIAANWGLALIIHRMGRLRGYALALGIGLNVLGIGIFKYANFIVDNLNVLGIQWSLDEIALPIGISFFTFQAISYLVDVYRGTVKPQGNPLAFGTYLAMFSQLIAGPIVRYQTIAAELRNRQENWVDFLSGLERFCMGLCKKILLANTMGYVADTLLGTTPHIGALPAWTAFIAYAFQIYFDFSGYSDMAIGLGRMFGFHFLENFNYPYIARSITDFWRRWHMSLSSFFRDYVYVPLGGNRVGTGRWIFNLAVVWALTGLWHGASWNFVLWGCYYGLFLLSEKLVWGRFLSRRAKALQHLYTILVFIVGWVIFRIENPSEMVGWMMALAGAHGMGQLATLSLFNVLHLWPWFLVAALAATPGPAKLVNRVVRHRFGRVSYGAWMSCLLVYAICVLVTSGFNPFLYFRF